MLDLAAGALLRALFLATTLRTPGHGAVPTTDVDHAVAVRGAAAAVVAKSACGPYADPSFRYPPTVALLAAPALTLHPAAAKALYCLFDLGVAALAPPGAPRAAWALNPLAAALAARGSADAATAVLVLLALRGVRRARSTAETTGGKGQQQHQHQHQHHHHQQQQQQQQQARLPGCALAAAAGGGAALGVAAFHRLVPAAHALPLGLHVLHAHTRHAFLLVLAFVAGAGLAGGALTAATLAACGRPYWRAAVSHHASRVDARHSFAPAFLATHLDGGAGRSARWVSSLSQAVAVVAAGCFGSGTTPATAAALQALAFVTLNRVATAQYWVWWGALLPAAAGEAGWRGASSVRARARLGWAAAAWAAAQAAWVWCAHRLELRGGNVTAPHLLVWVAALAAQAGGVGLFVGLVGVAGGERG